MAKITGINCKVYFSTTTGQTAPSSGVLSNVKDVNITLNQGTADTTTREANGWETSIATLKNASVGFTMLYEAGTSTSAGFSAIRDAFENSTALAFVFGDSDGKGLDADFYITDFSINQGNTEAVSVSVTCVPANISRAPSFNW